MYFLYKRRDFIALIGGAAVAWPLAARAQQPGKLPTIGFRGGGTPTGQRAWVAAFLQRLRELGWIQPHAARVAKGSWLVDSIWRTNALGAATLSRMDFGPGPQ
jgi:hypothetical protein